MSVIHLSPFSPPRKKLRFPQHPDFPLDVVQFPIPTFSGNPLNPLCCVSSSDHYNAPAAGIQGARHAQIGISLSDLHLNNNNNKLQLGVFPKNPETTISNDKSKESLSCLLTIGNSHKRSLEIKSDNNVKRHQFLLFGQPILTEQQISRKVSSDDVLLSQNKDKEKWFFNDTSASAEFCWQLGLDTGHCKVFLESEDVGRTLDLSCVGSYEELYRKLAKMFGIERSEMLSRVLYRDATGAVKQTGEEPFRY
ncbi:auxin response factor 18-like [Trifolium medium]|uniref:Auxin response factor 18-like n=1 Tax=Trifolium medium TaxID=97028 RepID=A0A392NC78_9FABA|nr:auxin response factor 18-like [Trifolium medium]